MPRIELDGLAGFSCLHPDEREAVLSNLPENKHGRILEVGTYHGASVAYFAKHRPNLEFLSVDPFAHIEMSPPQQGPIGEIQYWQANRQPNQRLFVGTLADLVEWLHPTGRRFHAAFIDGPHRYEHCMEDMRLAWRLTPRLFVHDYDSSTHPEVPKAVNDFVEEHRIEQTIVLEPRTVLLKQGF